MKTTDPPDPADAWLRQQQEQRRWDFSLFLAAEARRAKLAQAREAELAQQTVKVRARQCLTCWEVRTPAGTCNCTEG